MFSWIAKMFSSDKGVIEQVSDTVDKWNPSDTTLHKQSIEDLKSGDESQDSARKMILHNHESKLDIVIDGLNRLVRPIITYWVVGGLMGLWELPQVNTVDPLMMNIVWTVITFWFGSRVIFKDIPKALIYFNGIIKK